MIRILNGRSRRSKPKKLAVVTHGRLGNQLFQFAALHAIVSRSEPVLIYDGLARSADLQRTLVDGAVQLIGPAAAARLGRFPIPASRHREIPEMLARCLDQSSPWIARRHTWNEGLWYGLEPIPVGGRPKVVRGYFQNEGYFAAAREAVGASFRPPSEAVLRSRDSLGRHRLPTVAVVVHAGADYDRLGWTPPLAWYMSALDEMRAMVGDAHVVVFSDIAVARQAVCLLASSHGPVSEAPGLSAVDQLNLISLLDHTVVAPSSFAWWGAWLGDHRTGYLAHRRVIAPTPWIDPLARTVPDRWVSLRLDATSAPMHPTLRARSDESC